MPLIASHQNPSERSLTLIAEFAFPPERVWALWSSPGNLARWWGPAGQEMRVEKFELEAGSSVQFHVVGPRGHRTNARFDIIDVDAPHRLRFDFVADGIESTNVDVHIELIEAARSRMTITTTFRSGPAMQQAVDIGFDRGLASAVRRADTIVAEAA
jgi:uncharacterized protein YndB with AHSA1/START domain